MLKIFGQTILNYFLINYPDKCSFKLSVDDYTFSEFASMAGIPEEEIVKNIQKRDTYFYDDLEALAKAAYQVKIVGDVDSIMSSGSDSYYQKIKDNYSSYKDSDNNRICNDYFSNQINLWRKVQKLFKKNGRNLEIPEDHSGPGRYVQYPIKSHEMKNIDLLRWADKFRKRGLKPNDISVSYQVFCSLCCLKYGKESYKRTIFNFYKIWDGRSYSEILNRSQRTSTERDSNSFATKIVMDYQTAKIDFYNQESGEKIKNISEVQKIFYSQSNKVFFVQNEEDEFYSAKKNKIDFGLNFIIVAISDLNISDSFLENKLKQDFGNEKLFVYVIKFSEAVCTELHIDTAQKPPLNLVGGLKKSRNCYYYFGLPAIEFSEQQKVMFVNTNKVPIDSNRVVLSELQCLKSVIIKKGGNVVIQLPDYLPIKFEVVDIDFERKSPDEIGWGKVKSRYVPVTLASESKEHKESIIGFISTFKFKPVHSSITNIESSREFLIHKEYLENRFSKRKELQKWQKNI